VFTVLASDGQKPQFRANFVIWGTPVPTPDEGQIWCARLDPRSTLTRQISSECVHCRLPVAETHNFGQILTFWGSCTDPLLPMSLDEGQIWCGIADAWYTLKCQISSRFLLWPALCWRKNPQFLPFFWTSAFTDVANWQQSKIVEHGCTTTKLPLSNGIKIVSLLQRLHGEIGRTNSGAQKGE